MIFAKAMTSSRLADCLVGHWRADTASASAAGSIDVVFGSGGDFLLRNRLDIRGVKRPAVSQVGRFQADPIDKRRFRLSMTDEFGAPVASSVRWFADDDTMVCEIGQVVYRRLSRDAVID